MQKKILLSCFILLFTILSCVTPVSRITSEELNDSEARIKELGRYFNIRTDIIDAEFDIYDTNLNSRDSIPGATTRDYKIAVLTEKTNIDAWLTDVNITSFPVNYTWSEKLINNNKNFKTDSKPLLYKGNSKELILFKDEGIIFIRIKQY
jgi:hypothetical protein